MSSEKLAYVGKFRARLVEWEQQIDQLKAKAAQASAHGKVEYERTIQEMKARRDRLRGRIEAMKEVRDEDWDTLKRELDRMWTELEEALARLSKQ
jgi:hypothetical protein